MYYLITVVKAQIIAVESSTKLTKNAKMARKLAAHRNYRCIKNKSIVALICSLFAIWFMFIPNTINGQIIITGLLIIGVSSSLTSWFDIIGEKKIAELLTNDESI